MEFMGFHIVDIVIVSLVAFLAIKGLVNGFSKELLSFFSIVAGVVLAARYNMTVVELINEQKLAPEIPEQFAKIIGFILIVLVIWLIVGVISSIINKMTSGPSGFVSRVLGYILSAARYVFIFSLIIFGVSQSEFFKKQATDYQANTELFKPMSELGANILNIEVNQTIGSDTNVTKKVADLNLTDVNLSTQSEVTIENNSSN